MTIKQWRNIQPTQNELRGITHSVPSTKPRIITINRVLITVCVVLGALFIVRSASFVLAVISAY